MPYQSNTIFRKIAIFLFIYRIKSFATYQFSFLELGKYSIELTNHNIIFRNLQHTYNSFLICTPYQSKLYQCQTAGKITK